MERIDTGPPAAVQVQVEYDGGPTGNPGELPFTIHPKTSAEYTLKQICSLFDIHDHYSHFGLYNYETGREVYATGIVKDNDRLRLKPLPAQKFISRAEVIISKTPAMASKALKHLNDHFIILASSNNSVVAASPASPNHNNSNNNSNASHSNNTSSNNNSNNRGGHMVVDSVFVSPFLMETIVKVIIGKPHFVDLLVRLVNFPKIRVVLTTAFLGNARRAFTPIPTSPGIKLGGNRPDSPRMVHSSSEEDVSRPRTPVGMPSNDSSPDLQDLERTNSSSSISSAFAYTSAIQPSSPPEHLSSFNASKYARESSIRKLDVFTLVRDTFASARLPPPFTDFFRYLLSDRMNEGIVTRCVLLLNCLLGIAELTVVWGDVDEADLVGLPADTISSITQSVGTTGSHGGSDMDGSSYGLGSGAANRYVAFKHGIRTAGVIDALMAYAMQERPIAPLRSAISGFQDHLFRPLDMLALGALDHRKQIHGKLLERIWWAAFPDTTYPGHLADDWRFVGFRGNPFLTPTHSLISIHALAHFATNHTKLFRAILIEQSELSFRKKGYPLGALACHLSSMLVSFYQFGILRREPSLIKYLFGPDPTELFYKLSDMVLILTDEMWKRAGFTFSQFLPAVRNMQSILQRAHKCDPANLEELGKLIQQFVEEDFPENAYNQTSIVLKRSTFVLEDPDLGEAILDADGEGSPRIYIKNKEDEERWRKRIEERRIEIEEEEEEQGKVVDGAERMKQAEGKKGSVNLARLARFFGESPEEGYQFAPQPPNVKMVKLKRIFGESVDTNGGNGADPEVKEYNKRYRDSLNEEQLHKLESERAHRLHAFFGEWFDTTAVNKTIKHTKKPSLTSPDITDLVVIRKISMPPPNASSPSAIPTIHLAVQPPNDFSASASELPHAQTLALAFSPLLSSSPADSPSISPSPSPNVSPRPELILEPARVPELTIVPPDSNVSISPRSDGSSSPDSSTVPPPDLVISAPFDPSASIPAPDLVVSAPPESSTPIPTIFISDEDQSSSSSSGNKLSVENINIHNNENALAENYSDTASTSPPTPTMAPPPPNFSLLARAASSPTPPPSSSPTLTSSPSRSHRIDAWRPALNRTNSAPLNPTTRQSPRGSKRMDGSAIGTRSSTQFTLRRDDDTSSVDDTASYTSADIGEEEKSNHGTGRFSRLSKWFSKHDSTRPPSPTTNKRLKRNILKQLFGERINKDLNDLMNEPSIQHEKTASTTRRDRQRGPNSLTASTTSLSSTSSSSSAPSSASSSPQHSPVLRPISPNMRVREASLESDNQALARFRFMNRMKSKSATSIPMGPTRPPVSPTTTAKRYHTYTNRKPNYPTLQVYQI